jgi:hypothetical protein
MLPRNLTKSLCAGLTLSFTAQHAHATFPGENDKIVFVGNQTEAGNFTRSTLTEAISSRSLTYLPLTGKRGFLSSHPMVGKSSSVNEGQQLQ